MRVVVPSMGRTFDLRTIFDLWEAGLKPWIYVPQREVNAYKIACPTGTHVVGVPDKIKGIALTRQYILDTFDSDLHESLVMVDDDLSFHVRRKDDETKFLPATPADIARLFRCFERQLKYYAHVSMIGRQGGNRVLADQECARPWHVFGFNVPEVKAAGATFQKGLLQDDFDMTLQLLRAGLPNYILSGWAVNQHHGHGAPGGAASYRTVEDHNKSILQLQKRHPEFVSVREKTYARNDPLGTRLEATIQWKKAFKSAGA